VIGEQDFACAQMRLSGAPLSERYRVVWSPWSGCGAPPLCRQTRTVSRAVGEAHDGVIPCVCRCMQIADCSEVVIVPR
jgi:hypothetical protein